MATTQNRYSPSWVDRLTDWIEGLPIPVWAFYAILYAVAALGLNGASWFNEARPWGEFSLLQLYNAIWLPLALIVIHNTDSVAHKALDRFAPLVKEKSKQLDNLRYEMTTMPRRTVLWISVIAIIFLTAGAIQDPTLIVYEFGEGPIHPAAWFLSALFGISSYSMAPVMIYHAIRQLNRVTQAFALIENPSIFHQQPLYAFSGLAMRTALFLVGQVYITYLGDRLYSDVVTGDDLINGALTIVMIPLALVMVLAPLWGIHQRLSLAKQDALEENSFQIERAQRKLYAAIDQDKYTNIGGLDSALDSINKVRDQLASVPTWPWAAGTFRNFLSAVFLPMLLWALQLALGRFLGS